VSWPQWWRGVVRVEELVRGDARRIGSRYLIEWRSRIPYPLVFEFTTERSERPALMEGRAEGELQGRGCWKLFEEGGVTAVIYDWRVATTKPWMNAVAPLGRPLFAWNHDAVIYVLAGTACSPVSTGAARGWRGAWGRAYWPTADASSSASSARKRMTRACPGISSSSMARLSR
jgi:hypothetical protein